MNEPGTGEFDRHAKKFVPTTLDVAVAWNLCMSFPSCKFC